MYALIPCAGTGARAGSAEPKQYRHIAGLPMVVHTLRAFHAVERINQGLIVVAPDDQVMLGLIQEFEIAKFQVAAVGGAQRSDTVLAGLNFLLSHGAQSDDWVLVHDAARPGITPDLINKLITAVNTERVGGLLAIPLADTLKQADLDSVIAGNIPHSEKTIPREHLWQAQTPQMFGISALHEALVNAIRLEADITDEASAMELAGFQPLLIEGATRNFKVTHPADWDLMQLLLQSTKT